MALGGTPAVALATYCDVTIALNEEVVLSTSSPTLKSTSTARACGDTVEDREILPSLGGTTAGAKNARVDRDPSPQQLRSAWAGSLNS